MNKPPAQTILKWLRDNLGKGCLAPLTSTDVAALQAAVQVIELYSYASVPTVLEAFRVCVLRMQAHTQHFAYHAIAHVMEWSTRERIWQLARLPEIEPGLCKFEPRGHLTH